MHPRSITQRLSAGDGSGALAALLAAWREFRDPRLSCLIIALGRRSIADPAQGLAGSRGKAVEQAWVDRIRSVSDEELTPFLESLGAYLEVAHFTWPFVDRALERAPDPRIAAWAQDLLNRFHTLRHTSSKLRRRLIYAIERHGDVSSADWADRAELDHLAWQLEEISRIHPASQDEVDAMEALIRAEKFELVAVPDKSVKGDELLEMVYRNPASDEPRLVYGDWLCELGDPRGEFIALQFRDHRGGLSRAGRRRMEGLQKDHCLDWLRPIWPALARERLQPHGPLVFKRGFLGEASVARPRRPPSDLWIRPEWATVRRINGKPVVDPAMRALSHLTVSPLDFFSDHQSLVASSPLRTLTFTPEYIESLADLWDWTVVENYPTNQIRLTGIPYKISLCRGSTGRFARATVRLAQDTKGVFRRYAEPYMRRLFEPRPDIVVRLEPTST